MKHAYKETSSNDANDEDGISATTSPIHSHNEMVEMIDIEQASEELTAAREFGNNEFMSKDYDVNFAQLELVDRYNVDVDKAELYSWFVNVFLLIAKLYIGVVSNSKAVWASVADSIVDLLSQAVLSIATKYIRLPFS